MKVTDEVFFKSWVKAWLVERFVNSGEVYEEDVSFFNDLLPETIEALNVDHSSPDFFTTCFLKGPGFYTGKMTYEKMWINEADVEGGIWTFIDTVEDDIGLNSIDVEGAYVLDHGIHYGRRVILAFRVVGDETEEEALKRVFVNEFFSDTEPTFFDNEEPILSIGFGYINETMSFIGSVGGKNIDVLVSGYDKPMV